MPQLALEFTANIKQEIGSPALFAQLHQVLVDVGGIPLGNCKSRAIRLDDFYIAGGEARHAFVHLSIRFLEGRSTELKQQIGRQCLAVLEKLCSLFGRVRFTDHGRDSGYRASGVS